MPLLAGWLIDWLIGDKERERGNDWWLMRKQVASPLLYRHPRVFVVGHGEHLVNASAVYSEERSLIWRFLSPAASSVTHCIRSEDVVRLAAVRVSLVALHFLVAERLVNQDCKGKTLISRINLSSSDSLQYFIRNFSLPVFGKRIINPPCHFFSFLLFPQVCMDSSLRGGWSQLVRNGRSRVTHATRSFMLAAMWHSLCCEISFGFYSSCCRAILSIRYGYGCNDGNNESMHE